MAIFIKLRTLYSSCETVRTFAASQGDIFQCKWARHAIGDFFWGASSFNTSTMLLYQRFLVWDAFVSHTQHLSWLYNKISQKSETGDYANFIQIEPASATIRRNIPAIILPSYYLKRKIIIVEKSTSALSLSLSLPLHMCITFYCATRLSIVSISLLNHNSFPVQIFSSSIVT